MTVDDEEPLTGSKQKGEVNISAGPSGGNTDKLNTILTTALHKHAATKLAKKLTRNKTNAPSEDDAEIKKERKDTKKKAKNKKFKEEEKGEEVELQVISEVQEERKRSRRKKQDGGQKRKEEELDAIKEAEEDSRQDAEKENEEEKRRQEEEEKEGEEGAASPTRRYLAAVSVPKKRNRASKRNTGGVLGVTVHTADRFEGSPLLLPHPLVQVYMVECDTGQLVSKRSREGRATSYYEAGRVDHILPIMTQPFHLSKARSVVCRWEEELVFNEPIGRFTSADNPVMVFFQLMDFPDTAQASGQVGWLTFAWAFLKICGANDRVNVGQRLRLQLWRPRRTTGVTQVDLYSWWKSGSRLKYPSTLYVTLQEVTLPPCPAPALRSMLATQAEVGGGVLGGVQGSPASGSGSSQAVSHEPQVKWNRRPHQPCHLPERVLVRLPPNPRGCMVVKFSQDGLRLACGGHGIIHVYSIPSGKLEKILPGHMGLVYDLCWDSQDTLLLSASADATARVWFIGPEMNQPQILTHPAFVYSAIFLPSGHVATGCYDHLVRIWVWQKGRKQFSLVQELPGHQGYITTLCLTQDGKQVLSGDSQGVIMVWEIEGAGGEKQSSRRKKVLRKDQRVVLDEIRGVAINALVAIPEGRRVLVHSRDSQLRLVCGRTWVVTQRLTGAVNVIQQLRGCVTPCATWIIAGDEEGTMHAWHSDTGLPANSLPSIVPGPLSCVDYHPYDHLAAMAFCSPDTPVLLLGPQSIASNNLPDSVPSQSEEGGPVGVSASLRSYSSLPQDIGSPVLPSSLGFRQNTLPSSLSASHTSHFSHSHSVTQEIIQSQVISQQFSQSFVPSQSQGINTQHLSHSQVSSASIFNEELVRRDSGSRKGHHHQKDSVLRKLDAVLKMVTTEAVSSNTWRLSSTTSTTTPQQQQKKKGQGSKVIAVPSSSGGVSFLSDPEVTPSKARTRRHKVAEHQS